MDVQRTNRMTVQCLHTVHTTCSTLFKYTCISRSTLCPEQKVRHICRENTVKSIMTDTHISCICKCAHPQMLLCLAKCCFTNSQHRSFVANHSAPSPHTHTHTHTHKGAQIGFIAVFLPETITEKKQQESKHHHCPKFS